MFTNMRRRHSNCIHEVINPQIYIIQSNLKNPQTNPLISDIFLVEFGLCFDVNIFELFRYYPCTMYASFISCLKSESIMYESIMLHKNDVELALLTANTCKKLHQYNYNHLEIHIIYSN